jgi:hypothetical protein
MAQIKDLQVRKEIMEKMEKMEMEKMEKKTYVTIPSPATGPV